MKHEFRLADIGEGLEEAEIVAWLVDVGDHVQRDQPIVEVLTDKSNAELPAPTDGVIVSRGGELGDMIEVGELLAIIDDQAPNTLATASDTTDEHGFFQQATAQPTPAPAAASEPQHAPPADAPTGPRPKASPAVRLEAARRGLDLTAITGSGPGGRILRSDLDQPTDPVADQPVAAAAALTVPRAPEPPHSTAASAPTASGAREQIGTTSRVTPEPPPAGVQPLRGIRRVIAQNMAKSWSTIPHIHALDEIDAESLLELRRSLRASDQAAFESITPLSFMVAAVATALKEHPEANASLDLDEGTITTHPAINVGIAVAAPQGLVVPVVRDAGALSLAEIAGRVRSLVEAARGGQLSTTDFAGGTATITNFGALGGQQAMPLIRPPESVIFGFGSIAPRPFVVDDQVMARRTMHLVIGADHRLLDGDVTTALLRRVADLLERPINLLVGG